MIDVSDFWTQTLAAIAAAVVMLFVQTDWIRKPDRKPGPSAPAGGNQNHAGNQAVIADSDINGSVWIGQSYTDNSHRTTINNNINQSAGTSDSDDVWAEIVLVGAVVLVSAVLFVVLRPLLQAVSIGAIVAIFIMLTVAILRTRRLRVWTKQGVLTVVVVGAAIVLMFIAWASVGRLQRDEVSLDTISAGIPTITTEQSELGLSGHVDYFMNSVIPGFFGVGPTVLLFVVCLMVAVLSATALLAVAWIRLLDWHAFLGFNRGSNQKPKLAARAKSFKEGGIPGIILGVIGLGVITIVCSSGTAYDLWQSLTQK